ncbi:F-box only protein 38 [Desmophyllum pertusum]|uniref:F-box only protein 38 n=1 Tax=Desmophyllum pertusum TaxID=174260 RepID=A0A9W9YZS0_9CNID|nr:F-box only protein 38 [Desmophyllum pertusum]
MDQKEIQLNVDHLPAKDIVQNASCPGYRLENTTASSSVSFDHLSLEILVKIMSSLTLKEILLLEMTSKKLSVATTIHLRTRKSVDFTEGKWYGEMSPLITDGIFSRLLQRCPEAKNVFGIHPRSVTKRQQRHADTLSVDGITAALTFYLGYLVLVSAFRLEELLIQPSLTKDAVFSALLMAHAEYPRFECLHLGYVDDFPEKGQYTDEELLEYGLIIEREQTPALSDRGMKLALQVFPQVRYLSVHNCPNLRNAALWFTPNLNMHSIV